MTPDTLNNHQRQTPPVWRWLEKGLGLGCALVLTAMMLLTGSDVIARYILNAPIKGAFELTEIMLVCFVFLAMPLAMLSNAHVEVELWEPRSRAGNLFRIVLSALAAILVFGALAWQLLDHAGRLKSYGSVSNSLSVPLYLIAWVAAAGCLLGAIIAARQFVLQMKGTSND